MARSGRDTGQGETQIILTSKILRKGGRWKYATNYGKDIHVIALQLHKLGVKVAL